MRLTSEMLVRMGVREDRARAHLANLNRALPAHGIDGPLRVAHFLAQVLHESGMLRHVEENLNYSAEGLLKVFRKYFTPARAAEYARKPARIGARVYASRMGNGDEASGDGYRYRGRGLIQLTGKSNYREFSAWIGDDVVADPDRVATRYAVDSAVFYWDSRNINALADADDVRAVTRAVNGGLNGLDDRIALLQRAKSLLAIEAVAPLPEEPTHTVSASRLNLRSRPKVTAATRIGALAQGTPVTRLGDGGAPGWSRVRTRLNGQVVEGVVASKHLAPIPAAAPPPPPPPTPAPATPAAPALPAAHLRENRRDITRARDGGRAYPLGEAGMPRRTGSTDAAKVRALNAIVDWLDSENAAHQRYRPRPGTTYCNIYAHDYCYLAGAYLPRVWWTASALAAIRAGRDVEPRYAETVRELNANMLLDWLEEFGPAFGWVRAMQLDVLQAGANRGEVCVLVAQRADLNRSGHVVAVVPESEGLVAARSAGAVARPVESQAGTRNHRRVVKPSLWWAASRFQAFGMWRHP